MISNPVHRYLDPDESLGEILFGLIMALTFTLGARLLAQRDVDPHEMVGGMLGCNVAWGIIDAALYLLGSVFNRNRRIQFARRLRATASEAEAIDAIRAEFGLEGEPLASEGDRTAFYKIVLEALRRTETKRARLRGTDFAAAAAIAVLVSLTAVPGVLPFLFLDDGHLALRAANAIQLCLLFFVGFGWAHYTGANAWRTGLSIVALGVGLVAVAVALGG
jgi:hypothetical protein